MGVIASSRMISIDWVSKQFETDESPTLAWLST
jgi:hypothetical protein